jgi:hypothetical protein
VLLSVPWIIRVIRVIWVFYFIRILALFESLNFIGFVCVVKDIRVIITLREYAKEREAPSECQGRWGVCNLSTHFAGRDCTHGGRRERPHGLRPGARRRQGCPRHQDRNLCSLIRLSCHTRIAQPIQATQAPAETCFVRCCVCVRTVVVLLLLVYVYSDDCALILCLYAH